MNKVCRSCLNSSEHLILLDSCLITKLELLAPITVEISEHASWKLCVECDEKIQDFINFREMVIRNDAELRSWSVEINQVSESLTGTEEIKIIVKTEEDTDASLEVHDVQEELVNNECFHLGSFEQVPEDFETLKKVLIGTTEATPLLPTRTVISRASATSNETFVQPIETVLVPHHALKIERQSHKPTKKSRLVPREIAIALPKDPCMSAKWTPIAPKEPIGSRVILLAPIITSVGTSITPLDSSRAPKKPGMSIKCTHCDMTFEFMKNLRQHKKIAHREYAVCTICGIQVLSRYIEQHMSTHLDQPVQCEECGKLCKNPAQLGQHKNVHKSQELICDVCGKIFATKARLQQHLQVHYKIEKKKKECDICGKEVLHLQRHKIIHKDYKHTCRLCGFQFRRMYDLNQHMLKPHVLKKEC